MLRQLGARSLRRTLSSLERSQGGARPSPPHRELETIAGTDQHAPILLLLIHLGRHGRLCLREKLLPASETKLGIVGVLLFAGPAGSHAFGYTMLLLRKATEWACLE